MNWLKKKAREFLDGLFRLPTRFTNGYLQFFDDMKGAWQWVHRKVAEIVRGEPIPGGHEVHHVNRDKLDNDPDNLQVLTKEEHQDVHKNDYKKQVDRVNKMGVLGYIVLDKDDFESSPLIVIVPNEYLVI